MQNVDEPETQNLTAVPEESAPERLLDEVQSNQHYYHEPAHALRYWLHITPILMVAVLAIATSIVVFHLFTRSIVSESWFLLYAFMTTGLLIGCYFFIARERWMYRNWTLEVNPEHNAITLYRPGNRKLFVPERNARTIPLEGSAVTKNEQNIYEQYRFTRSSTVTIDNEIQGDEMFHDMKFVRDGYRLREAIIWYGNMHRREERAELEVLVEVRDLLAILVKHFCPDQMRSES